MANPTNETTCKECHQPYWSQRRHNITAHAYIQCDCCPERLRSDRLYKKHMRNEHPNIPLAVRCKKCAASYSSHDLLDDHTHTMHGADFPFECSECGQPFRTMVETKAHLMAAHAPSKLANKVYQSRMESCSSCGTRTRDLFIHHREHHWPDDQPAPFECDLCSQRFLSRYKITSHMKNHINERKLHCTQCSMTFNHTSSLRRHALMHDDTLQYQCEMCGLDFKHISSLKLHIKTHTGEKPYKCDMCEKAYSTSVSLKMHRRIHMQERSYKCDMCEWAFYDVSTLNVHRRQHSGENPFICHICRKACKQASNLKSHYTHVHKNVQITGQEIRNNARIFALYSAEELRTGDLSKMLQESGPVFVARGRQPNTNRIWPIIELEDNTNDKPPHKHYPRVDKVYKEEFEAGEIRVSPSNQEYNEGTEPETSFEQINEDNKAETFDQDPSTIVMYDDGGSPMPAEDSCDIKTEEFETGNFKIKIEIEIDTEDKPLVTEYQDLPSIDEQPVEMDNKPQSVINIQVPVSRKPPKVYSPKRTTPSSALAHPSSFECYICKATFTKRDNLKGHMCHMHLPKRHMCHLCGSAFATSNGLRRHLLSHSDARPYPCTTCSRKFKCPSRLKLHAKTHTENKQFICVTCAKPFHSSVGLKLHERLHTGEKPFGCDHCPARFADSSCARQHRLIHTGELPYRCHLCDKGCTQVGNLKSHLRHFHKINVANVPLAELKTLREPAQRPHK